MRLSGGLLDLRADAGGGEGRAPWDDYWYQPVGMRSASGVEISSATALSYHAFFACLAVVSEDVASQPIGIYRYKGDGDREEARDHPLWSLLHDRPNEEQTAFEWVETMMAWAALRGAGRSRIRWSPRGNVEAIEPVNPDRLRRVNVPGGGYKWELTRDSGGTETLLPEEVFSWPGRLGVSILTLARETVGLGLAAQEHAARQFGQGMSAAGAIIAPKALSDNARKNLRASIDERWSGLKNSHRPILLEEDLKWQAMSLTNTDAQFLESQQWSVANTCRWFRMAPHMIQDLQRSTNNNITQQSIEHAMYCIRPHDIRGEQAIKRDLITEPGTYFAKLNMASLLRGDPLAQAQALLIERNAGVINANEWRALLDRNRRMDAGGDVYWEGQPGAALPGANRTPQGPPGPGRGAGAIATAAAQRVVNREQAALARLAKRFPSESEMAEFNRHADEFFGSHPATVAETLAVPLAVAERYAAVRREALRLGGLKGFESNGEEAVADLVALALMGEE